MSASAKIISKVRKLLAMAADTSSPNEAAMAANRARAYMDKHQLTIKDLVESDGFNSVLAGASRKFTAIWEQDLAVKIALYNDCVCSFSMDENGYKKLNFKGFDSDVIVAKYMFGYIVEAGKKQCSVMMKAKGYTRYNASVGTAFKNSFGHTVSSKIEAMTEERRHRHAQSTGTSLVVTKNAAVEARFGVVLYRKKSIKEKHGDAYDDARRQGKKAGENTSIHTGLTE